MKDKGTYRFFAALRMTVVALLAGACVEIQGPEGGDSWGALKGDHPISFNSSLEEPSTKTTTSLPANSSFGVFAFYQPGTIGGAAGTWGGGSAWTPNFMYNQEVEYSGTAYTYAPIKYWPNNEENTITFWAYYPYGDTGITRFRQANSSATYSNTSTNIPDIEYITNGHTDLLVSDVKTDQHYRGDTPANPDATVHFTFHHAMCLVDFTVQKNDPSELFEISLKAIRIDTVYFAGVYNQALGWIATQGARSNLSVFSGSQLLQHPDPLDASTNPVAIPVSGGTPAIPLPQYLRFTSATLYVAYTMKRTGALGEGTLYECEAKIGNITEVWEKDKRYTYHITINPGNPILFTAEVVAWDAEQNAYYTFE